MKTRSRVECILEALTWQIRMISLRQAQECWWPQHTDTKVARRQLLHLVRGGWLERYRVNAHPLLPVHQPLAAWRPGQAQPDPETVSQQSRKRWSQAAVAMEVFVASPLTASLMGSTARGLPRAEQWDHDLLLASVFGLYQRRDPSVIADWLGEHALPKAGYRIKDPDAFLVDPDGRIHRVIESAGRYTPDQVESFHEHCAERELPYELW